MIGSLSLGNQYFEYGQYRAGLRQAMSLRLTKGQEQSQQAQETAGSQDARATGAGAQSLIRLGRTANPDVPVEPVDALQATGEEGVGTARTLPFMRQGADPAEMAVRMRMQPYDTAKAAEASKVMEEAIQSQQGAAKLPEDEECETCARRKYQDGSDDPGVSFKTAAHIAPEQAAATVRGHEMEHVVREQAKATREDRKVVSQSVTLHTAICPECGDVYVSGGTTRTVTKAAPEIELATGEEKRKPFFAVA